MNAIVKPFKLLFDFFASYGFAVFLILIMFALTLLGTLEQVEHGLYAVQKKYFESLFLVHDLYGIPIPLPGGFLVLVLFSINLICGGLIRIRKKKYTVGVIIGHIGILVMLVGGLVTFKWSDSGNMRLYEHEASNEFVSYYDWNIEIGEPGSEEVLLIPHDDLADLDPGESRTFYTGKLPFDVTVSGYGKNTEPLPVGPVMKGKVREIDGYFLQALKPAVEAEQNVAGAYVTLKDKASGEEQGAILWGLGLEPATLTFKGKPYTVELARKRWTVPFTVVLDKFTRELHPGTDMAASFESEITKIEGDSSEKIRIYMNNPLRHEGYTFFQASWGPPDAREGDPLFSVFAVVKNPADQVPLIACIIISAGLLIHFTQKLAQHIARENKRRLATT